MKILILSHKGAMLPLAYELQQANHEVVVYLVHSGMENDRPMVERVTSWRPHFASADMVLADSPGFGEYRDLMKESGTQTVGMSGVFDLAEFDYAKRLKLLLSANCNLPSTFVLSTNPNSVREDTSYIMFYKDAVTATSQKAYATTKEDIEFLNQKASNLSAAYLMEHKEGVTVQVTGLFNGRGWAQPAFIGFPLFGFSPFANLTEQVTGVAVRSLKLNSRLFAQSLALLTPALVKDNYRGMVTMTCSVVAEDEMYVLDMTTRTEPHTLYAILEGHFDKPADLFFKWSAGVLEGLNISDKPQACVSMHINSGSDFVSPEMKTMPINGITDEALKHIWLADVYPGKVAYHLAGETGVVGYVTAFGDTYREAGRRLNRTVGEITYQGKMVRTDVGREFDDFYRILTGDDWL